MAQIKTINTAELANLSKALVGFDRIVNSRSNTTPSNYPPHNIIKVDETNYAIELAVAGFSKEDIFIEVDQNILTIRGVHDTIVPDGTEFLHRGLAFRNFVVEFPLAQFMEVHDAIVKDGVLKIAVEYIIPETHKPRQISIN